MSVSPCELRVTPSCTGSALTGLRGCDRCRQALRDELRALPGLHESCAQSLTPGRRPEVVRVKGGGIPGGISLNPTAVSVRASVLGVLSSWTALIVDELGVERPPSRRVHVLSTFLYRNLDWLLAHEAAADLAEEITDLADAARAVLDPSTSERVDLGSCGTPGCGMTVYATIGAGSDAVAHGASCAAGHHVAASQWLLLEEPDEVAEGVA
ncbi:hypothetical protein V5P93_005127 [Actinokineospora auranticolor]|uniref:Uncharacterized protein n=1 Tax=Actinokineospora auranticolor TaxID=155976 RepID=A0A2S6GKA4_9PSEU|nr:hypothetical protein [Actinokineospora auranticolor]PPK65658.1 hypothetical protein CLV40_113142 [Actinokineospora auranticolor]